MNKSKKSSSPSAKPSESNAGPQTMADLLAVYENRTPRGLKRGDEVDGTVSSITGREVLIDIGGKMEGVVGRKEWDQVKNFVSTLKPGDKIRAVVISAENDRGQMVLSIKRASSGYKWERMKKLLDTGNELKVRVVELNKGGVLAESDGVRGFIPASQLAFDHQGELSKLLNRSLTVSVIEVDPAQNRLIFSEKAKASEAEKKNRLEFIKNNIQIGESYEGKVAAIMPYGLFVNLDNGAEGLVHISEVSWEKVADIASLYNPGDGVKVMVLGVNESDGKLNLSVKQLLPDPWLKISEKYSKDQTISGTVSQITNYGVFVTLEDGVDGLIRTAKIPADKAYQPGDKVECVIETIDIPAHKISLVPVLKAKPIGYK